VAYFSFAQNTLEVIDTGNITRERWRDSVLRMDKTRCLQLFCWSIQYEY
jgi:hypothetical protein